MMAMRDPIARLLDRQADLRLTTAQVNSLITIDDKLQGDNRPLRQRLAGWRGSMGRGDMRNAGDRKRPDSAQMAAMRTMHDSAMTVFRTMRENAWRAQSAAYAVLTPEQLATAAQLESRDGGGGFWLSGAGGRAGPRGGMDADGGPGGGGGMPGGSRGRHGGVIIMRRGPGGPSGD